MDQHEYDNMAAATDRHWWYAATRTLLAQILEPHLDSGPFLDAGGGNGATGAWMAARGPVVLADFEPAALRHAARQYPETGRELADIHHLPHPEATFGLTLCVTVLCHQSIPDPSAVVRELARVTCPGGVVVLMEPGVRRLRRGHDRVTHTARRFSRRDLTGLLRGAGLDLVRATGAYGFLVPPAAALAVVERGRVVSDTARNESGGGGLLPRLAAAERAVLRRVDLPAGLSVLAVGRRPSSPAAHGS